MDKKRIRDAAWFPNVVSICAGVLFFVFLWRFPEIWKHIQVFIGFFSPVITGCVIAYILNPLSKFFESHLGFIKKDGIRTLTANILTFMLFIISLVNTVMILIPQLANSIETFVGNLGGYAYSLKQMAESLELPENIFDINNLINSSEDIIDSVLKYVRDNAGNILSVSAGAGKGLVQVFLAFIMSIYLIAEKKKLKAGFKRLLKAVFGEKRYPEVRVFLKKCDMIFNRYIVFSIIDAIIIGGVNAIFMAVCGMQYVGLTSFIVGVTNLIPTFGPVIGAVIGGFILLMTEPLHALLFIIFTLILQTCDGYIIKPRLFGDSLGVSGLWILVGVVVGGNMFGVLGILLAIPSVAVIDFIYGTYIITALEKRNT